MDFSVREAIFLSLKDESYLSGLIERTMATQYLKEIIHRKRERETKLSLNSNYLMTYSDSLRAYTLRLRISPELPLTVAYGIGSSGNLCEQK
jgi:hypothetical protein